MPVVFFHLAEGAATPGQEEMLLREASRLYAEVLESPIERCRAFIQTYARGRIAAGGIPVSAGGAIAPFFEFIVLEGRPLEQSQKMASVFTDLLVDILGADRAQIRGYCRRVAPGDWSIAGTPASTKRKAEIEARARSA